MTWSRFDDLYDEHEKIEGAWDDDRATIGLHVMATTACNRWLSDGVIRPRWIKIKLPERRERERVLTTMVNHGLLDVLAAGDTRELRDSDENTITVGPFDEDRYIVHDFLDRHESSLQIKAKRQADAARKREGRRPDSVGTPNGVHLASARTPNGHRADSDRSPSRARVGARAPAPASRPDPSLNTPPSPPEGGRQRDKDLYEKGMAAFAGEHFPDHPVGLVTLHVERLRSRDIPPTVEALRHLLEGAAA